VRNYKLLKYSWETDPKVKAWKELSDKARAERQVEYITPFPTRHKINGEWVYPSNIKPKPKPTTKVPPDPRSDEQHNDDNYLNQCRSWDRESEKEHIKYIEEKKRSIRRDLREAKEISQTWNRVDFLGRTVESKLRDAERTGFLYAMNCPKQRLHLFDLIDYVNVRFDLNIRKDILTDKQYEKSKLIIDVAPIKTIGGADYEK